MSNSRTPLGKRFLSTLLVLVMVIGMLPTIAFAATREVTYYEKVTSLTESDDYLIVSGSYALNSDKTATPVTVDADKINSTTATVWTATKDGSNWTFKNDNNYLAIERSLDWGGISYTLNTSSDKACTWTLDSSKQPTVKFGNTSFTTTYGYLNLSGATWSAAEGSGSPISFYKKVTENQTLVGTDANGDEFWVKTDTVAAPTATAKAAAQAGEVWNAANANAAWANQKVLGIWDVTLKYGETAMQTVENSATVKISLDNFPGVEKDQTVTVARWLGNDTWDTATATVAEDLSVTATTTDTNPFVVVGPYTLVGTTAADGSTKEVWHYGNTPPSLNVTKPLVSNPDPGSENAKALDAATEKWGGLDLALYDVEVTYSGTVMKTLEKPVDVTLDVAGVKQDDAVMVAHWNGSSFDTPIQAKTPADNAVTFKADKFSPFVVVSGIGYNNITIINTTPGCTITGAGMVMTGTDYDFTVTVDPGYDADDLVVTANGNEFTDGGAKYDRTGNTGNVYSYTIHAVGDNYTISAIISKAPVVTHKVTFKANGSGVYDLPDPMTVAAGDKLGAAPADPGRDGYTFKGWNIAADGSGTAYNAETVPTADVVFYAQWQKVIPQYVVTYPTSAPAGLTLSKTSAQAAVDEGTVETFTVTLTEGYDPSTLVVTANGVELAPVAVDGSKYTYSFIVNAATTVAVLAPSKLTYTVVMPEGDTFTAEFTDHTTSKVLKYGDTYSFTVTPADGYTIDKVYVNGTEANASGGVYGPFTVEGEQSILVTVNKVVFYTVTYVVDGAQLTTRQVQSGTAVKTLGSVTIPAKEGYTASVWYNDQALSAAVTGLADTVVVSGDMELYAKYNPKTYTITYDPNGGTPAPAAQTKKHGEALNLSTTIPAKDGHTFLGWGIGADATTAVYQPGDQYSNNEAVTLVAVWQKNTYTVSLPSGTGYTVSSAMSNIVEYDGSYTFTVKVDRAYATTAPVVKWTKADGTVGATLANPNTDPNYTVNEDGSKSYTYTMEEIKENRIVSITVVQNKTYTVTFYTLTSDTTPVLAVYQTQQVEDTFRVDQPADPVMEGYTFQGWYLWTDANSNGAVEDTELATTQYSFDTAVRGAMKLVGKMTKNTYVVTLAAEGAGWTDDFVYPTGTPATTAETITVDHGTSVTFQVKVLEGYDASAMQVGVNGKLWAADSITASGNDTVYTYTIPAVTETTTITVVGVVRKTVTITYNANARDDVSGMPEQQVVKYYLASDNDKIINQIPVRTGYTFLGWSTNSKATAADTKYTKALIEANNAIADFTKDTTLYAIWEANSTSITLDVSDVAVAASGTENAKEYEGQPVTLTATLSPAVSTGSVNFYQNGKLLISVPANGSDTYTATAVTSPYKLDGTPVEDSYQVEYKAEGDEGYGSADKTTAVKVTVLSTTITWVLDDTNKVDGTDKLTVYDKDGAEVASGIMEANNVYTLKIPTVKDLNGETLTVGTDYVVEWIYKDEKGVETKYTKDVNGDSAVISAEYSKYQFRAVVTPVKDAARSVYNKAAGYNSGVLADDDAPALYTQWTVAVAREQTETALTIEGAVNEEQKITIDGTEVDFGAAHWAQFEGDKLVLKASVTIEGGTTPVSAGYVDFYRYNTDGTWTKLNADPVAVDENTGIATFGDDYNEAVLVKDYVDGTGSNADEAKANVDKFFAVYLANATWETSASTNVTYTSGAIATVDAPVGDDVVYVKSTTIKTPVIDSARTGKLNGADATYTSYDHDLTDLLAGVEHTFTLRTGNTDADYSVVALDGRTVAETDYTVEWIVKTGDNAETSAATGTTFTTSDNKVGDEIYVKLTAKNNMDKGEKSNKVIIGTKQDVNVTVVAEDKIASTASETDAYQLSEVKLTAIVKAKETDAKMQPGGTVTFYYELANGKTYKLGASTLAANTDGDMEAFITTTELPVKSGDNTKLDVTITAVYEGDATFNKSGEFEAENKAIKDTTTGTVTDDKITVYSSVVYVTSDVENVANNTVGQNHTSGIYIYAEEDKVLANETNVNLKLSDVYTLDHNIDLSKLVYGVDYTVQWQKLVNAASYSSVYAAADTPWVNIDGATNTTCQITVEQGAAYRAVITVKDTPIAKGSYTFVDQGTVGTADIKDGRQVYYSNILVANPAPPTVTVNVNTSNTTDGYEGIVEGETVTIHTFASGASGTTPISELTATVTKNGAVEPTFKQVKTNVNGHVSFDWVAAQPGYYTLTVNAKFTNGYSDKTITRTLIVRDNDYQFDVSGNTATYDGKVKGLTVGFDSIKDMDIERDLALDSVVVYYYRSEADRTNMVNMVEPTQAGTYYATIRLQESAYWTEKTEETTLTIKQREVSVVDLVAQAKVYDGTTDANIQEIILNDAETAQSTTGLPTGNTGVINGDSVYAIGTGYTAAATAGATTLGVKDVELKGDDAGNYKLVDATYSEAFNIQRSQVKGDIADSTFKYTGSNITVPASDIYLIDQAGNEITSANYTVTYYYHNGDGVEKVTAMNKLGKYTVIARPEQDNYKGGASETIYVVSDNAVDKDPDTTAKSALIDITNTVKLFDGTATGVTVNATKGTATASYYYNDGTTTDWHTSAPTDAGRYLVKATVTNGTVTDTAYGIYTIVKANPVLTLTAANVTYDSAPYAGAVSGTYNGSTTFPTGTYFTYTGGTIQGVAYEAPTEVGTYIVTAHVPETENYTAHEISAQFVITPKALKITADSLQRRQYGAFPDMTASFDGLADSTYAPDTSLRDVQIQPELIFNETDGYDNIAMDHVGNEYPIIAIAALARNYDVSYVNGNLSVTRDEPNPYLAIHGMIENGNGAENLAYYGDVIQLYAYGSQSETGVINNSSVLTWSVTPDSGFSGSVNIDENGLLTINGVGTFTVTLTRGVGAQKISTTLTITALKKEVKVSVPDEDVVYNATTQTYTASNMKAYDEKFNTVTGVDITDGNTTRKDVGSQIVTGKVADGVDYYQSETYGGLFTINDKEVTVKPDAASVVYGAALGTLTYTEEGIVTGTPALTNGKAVSIRDSYGNLDVGTYEILVAGAEDMNYNVKYLTNPGADKVTVNALGLTVSTGTLDANVGMTSGSLNPVGKFPVNGAEVNASATLGASNVRMYGEPNWVMDYDVWTAPDKLIAGDSLADLADLGSNLVDFNYNIGADANITYPTRTSTPPTYIGSLTAYPVDTDDSMIAFGNYTEDYTTAKGKQNIYQRPVTLKLANGADTLDVLFSDVNSLTVDQRTAYLRNLIVANLNVLKYTEAGQEVGGLATLLKHTANDLDYELTYTYDASGFDVTIKAINNYWSENYTIHVNVVKEKYRVVYNSFTATSATVTLYHVNLGTGAETAEFLPSGNLMCKIFTRTEDGSYLGETPVVNVAMQRTSTPGVYTVTYPRLVGSYRMFAIAEGGVGYTIVNGIK